MILGVRVSGSIQQELLHMSIGVALAWRTQEGFCHMSEALVVAGQGKSRCKGVEQQVLNAGYQVRNL